MKKQEIYYFILGLVIASISFSVTILLRGDRVDSIGKTQEMRCDYDGCVIVSKPQPFTGYNN